MRARTITLSIAILLCIVITGGYSVTLYHDVQKRLSEWKVSARETLVEALQIEVRKRSDIPVDMLTVNPAKAQTFEENAPDSVTLISKYGKKTYAIPREKFAHSLVKERKKRMLLSVLLEKYPVSVDTLNRNWDSLLLAKKIVADTYIRYSITDLQEYTTTTYSRKYRQNPQADSLTPCYMGYRCEVEAAGFVLYRWWQMIDGWQWGLLVLPWIGLCIFMFAYRRIISFFKEKFKEKEVVIHEKETIIEKEVHVTDVGAKTINIYRFEDGTNFDPVKRILRRGDKEKKVAPQITILLKLFLLSENLCLKEDEIYKEMWKGGGAPTQLSSLILRLRNTLKEISDITVIYDGNKTYQLKKAHSIEKNDDYSKEISTRQPSVTESNKA
ncbi:hypothetical protein [Bacteroides fluxus]|uniref:hypothetical protein n=1 Tax=Bacteroides fluxus TaxID=626930 RepID=UPI002A813A1A|nr:hypothetical protein [Bacteroides fluxus]MDY3790813.1 hypothetical protein [Bacteroides fluxus]